MPAAGEENREVAERAIATWESFCEDLKGASGILSREATPGDEQNLAEGLRFLMRMLRAGFENAFEYANPESPRLGPMVTPTLVYEGVTSDARYHHAFIDGGERYVIAGHRGDAPLIEFSVYNGKAGVHAESHSLGSLTERDLVVGADGDLEVAFGPEPRDGNWLRTDGNTRYLMVREYAQDWSGLRPGAFKIEREGGSGRRRALSLSEVEAGLAGTLDFVRRAPQFWAGISDYWRGFAVNRFEPQLSADPRTDIAAPTGHHFSCGWFELEAGEALSVCFSPRSAQYWSLGVANYWYETLGFADGGSEINNGSAIHAADGSVRAVIANAQAPAGAQNWIDTRGHREGTMIFRWSRSAEPVPPIATEKLRVEDWEMSG